MEHAHEGVWTARLGAGRGARLPARGHLRRRSTIEVDDPYRFLPTLGEVDLHLLNEGRHEELWWVLGARVHHYERCLGAAP